MGTYGDGEKKQGARKRGSTNNGARLSAFAQGKSSGSADWGAATPAWIQAVVVGISARGGACTFSLSRDRGAYGLRLMLDGDFQQLWFNGDADLDTELEKVFAVLEGMPEE